MKSSIMSFKEYLENSNLNEDGKDVIDTKLFEKTTKKYE
jgi:hypothetical protein